MVWVRLDDRFPEHPKVASLSNEAFRAHVEALCYCGRNGTDGLIPKGIANRLGSADELRAAGLWEDDPAGYRVHGFLDYNPTAEEAAERREKRSAAGRRGAAVRWGKANAKASAMASAMANRCDSDAPSPSPFKGEGTDGSGNGRTKGARLKAGRLRPADPDEKILLERATRVGCAKSLAAELLAQNRDRFLEALKAAESGNGSVKESFFREEPRCG